MMDFEGLKKFLLLAFIFESSDRQRQSLNISDNAGSYFNFIAYSCKIFFQSPKEINSRLAPKFFRGFRLFLICLN